jgi:2-polyprenyl-3-methyl-5-hydroxy-6-metoxy-1,4-benzoquinol methylase
MDSTMWDARYSTDELVWKADPNRFLVEEVRDLVPGRALDVACGEGRNAMWLAESGWDATGVDFSAVGLDKARSITAQRGVEVEWIKSDVVTWEPPIAAFDLILVAYLQLPEDQRRHVHRALVAGIAPGGTLLVVAHDSTNLIEGVGGPQSPHVLFSPDDVLHDVGGLGLEIVRAERVLRPVDTPQGPRNAIDALVRLARPR